MTTEARLEKRLHAHVRRLEDEHPPLDPAAADFTVHRPDVVNERYGVVLDYMARTELEVERNVLELTTLLPHPPEVDRYFYTDVWGPQEFQHGVLLDTLGQQLGRPAVDAQLTGVNLKLRVLGTLAHAEPVESVVRMLYYLTGMTTERSALLAYQRLHDGLLELGEDAAARTVVAPIRRQEPGHYAYYQFAARSLWAQLASWQQWLVRQLRSRSFSPVGAGTPEQRAGVGRMMVGLGLDDRAEVDAFAAEVSRLERELLWAGQRGLDAPPYIADAFRDCLHRATAAA